MNKRSEKLGMPIGTAVGKLRKLILFDFVKQLNKDTCFRCGKRIDSAEELSIEHKESYINSNDPVGLFFDLDNITFSHLKCNCGAGGSSPREGKLLNLHGTNHRYRKGCRCSECTKAHKESINKWRDMKRKRLNTYNI